MTKNVKEKPEDAIKKCPRCGGTGKYETVFGKMAHCDTCFGEGWIRQKHVDQGLIELEDNNPRSDEEPPVTNEEVEKLIEKKEEVMSGEVPEVSEVQEVEDMSTHYQDGYNAAKEYLERGEDIEKREMRPDFRGKSGTQYDKGWNKAIEEYRGK